MKILFIVPYVPTPIRVRPFQMVRTLARRGHDVTVATLWTTQEEREYLSLLQEEGVQVFARRLSRFRSLWNSLSAVPSRDPLQAAYCWHPEFAAAIHQLARDAHFDVVHVEHLRGAKYGLVLKQRANSQSQSPPVVWDSVDCITHLFTQASSRSRSLYGRLITHADLQRTRRYEGWLVSQFDRVLATSIHDSSALMDLAWESNPQQTRQNGTGSAPSTNPVSVVPNGVDLHYFASNGAPREPATIVFSGKMSYHANVTAAVHLVEDIMPLVWRKRPDVRVQIVGKDPPHRIRAFDTNGATNRPVTVTGTVPDIRPYLQKATIAVAPVPYGAGVQNKVLEAMACGTPVVASAQAASGLAADRARDLVVAEDAAMFADACLQLLEDPHLRSQVSQAGLAYVCQTHSWDVIIAELEGIYQEAMQRNALIPA